LPAYRVGFAILGQKQYPSALVRYLAAVRAEVFQCSFLFLSSSSVFQPACRQAVWAAVPGGRISNSTISPSAIVGGKAKFETPQYSVLRKIYSLRRQFKMKTFLLIIFLLSFTALQAQKKSTSIEFSFDSLCFDKMKTQCDNIEFEDKILKANIIDTTTKKTIAEFLRISDNSYYFRRFDKNGKTETEGKCNLSSKPIKSYKIPHFDNNGKFIKQIIISVFNFDKVGKWYEKVNDTIDRHGNYNRNQKIGKWTYLKKVSEFDAIEIKDEEYIHGRVKSEKASNLLETKKPKVFQTLFGQWKLLNDPTTIFPDSLINYLKINSKDLNNYRYSIKFETENTCIVSFGGSIHKSMEKYNCKWALVENYIIIEIPEKKITLKFYYVSSSVLRGFFTNGETKFKL
jgi:hypothetical protein